MSSPIAVAFFGATGGCGLSALKHALKDNATCIALCRTPEKLTNLVPTASNPNLIVKEGNAHSLPSVAACLTHPADPTRLVDAISFSIGAYPNLAKMSFEDPTVCENGIVTLLEALKTLRAQGVTGSPRLSVVSTTGISSLGRDVPLLMVPMYHWMLKTPHADKLVMENKVIASSEAFTIVRPSLLTDGALNGAAIRVGVEDPVKKVQESTAIGYTISRNDVGKWIWENALRELKYPNKAVSITY
ncbi:hypothetical protein ACHAQA_010131 [Verticillium albo-atrum]